MDRNRLIVCAVLGLALMGCYGGGEPLRPEGGSSGSGEGDAGTADRCEPECGARQRCVDGECVCTDELTGCDGECVDLSSHVDHCGDCGNACAADDVCAGGRCADTCPADTTNCQGSCVDTETSERHCGACDNECPGGTTCTGGSCRCTDAERTLCGDDCVDLDSDSAHCGECDNACGSEAACLERECTRCGPEATLSGDVQPIFDSHCASSTCHGGRRPKDDLSLEPGAAYGDLVGVPADDCTEVLRVDPGSPQTSYLVHKLTGEGLCAGKQMPQGEDPLPESQIDLVRAWICHGAHDG